MKKLFLTLMMAVVCGLASFAQTVNMTHDVMNNGQKGIRFDVNWSTDQGGSYQLRVYFTTAQGNYYNSYDAYRDERGFFCFTTSPMTANNNSNITTSGWIADQVLYDHLPKGGYFQAWAQIISGGNIVVQCQPVNFNIN